MALSFDLTPGFKKLSIIVGIIAALIVADIATRQYHVRRDKLDFLCTYKFSAACECPADAIDCLERCASLKEEHQKKCTEELKPSYYKLEDQYTWALLIFLPTAYGLGVGLVWVVSRFLKKR